MLTVIEKIRLGGILCFALSHAPSVAAQQADSARAREQLNAMLAERMKSAQQGVEAAKLATEKAAAEDAELLARGEKQLDSYDELVSSGNAKHTTEALRRVARDELAKVRRRVLTRTWGPALENEKAPAELRDHGRRMALLRRIRFLARQREAASLVSRADNLLARERARHESVMQSLANGGRQ